MATLFVHGLSEEAAKEVLPKLKRGILDAGLNITVGCFGQKGGVAEDVHVTYGEATGESFCFVEEPKNGTD